jgi:hypothetical protein
VTRLSRSTWTGGRRRCYATSAPMRTCLWKCVKMEDCSESERENGHGSERVMVECERSRRHRRLIGVESGAVVGAGVVLPETVGVVEVST